MLRNRNHRAPLTAVTIAIVATVTIALTSVTFIGGAPAGAAATGKATEIGVDTSSVHVAVIADVDNPIAPGVFKGVVDGAQAAAKLSLIHI